MALMRILMTGLLLGLVILLTNYRIHTVRVAGQPQDRVMLAIMGAEIGFATILLLLTLTEIKLGGYDPTLDLARRTISTLLLCTFLCALGRTLTTRSR